MSFKICKQRTEQSEIVEMTAEEFERITGNKCGKFKSRRGIA